MTCTVKASTLANLYEKISMLMRFGWAIQSGPSYISGEWQAVLYIHV